MTLYNPGPAIITAMSLRTAGIEISLSFDQGPFQDLGNRGPVVLSLLRYPVHAYHLSLKIPITRCTPLARGKAS